MMKYDPVRWKTLQVRGSCVVHAQNFYCSGAAHPGHIRQAHRSHGYAGQYQARKGLQETGIRMNRRARGQPLELKGNDGYQNDPHDNSGRPMKTSDVIEITWSSHE